MANTYIDHAEAARILEQTWDEAQKRKSYLDEDVKELIKQILGYEIIGYTYLMVTGILAKRTNPDANALAIQAGSELDGAYDARSLCQGPRGVVVPFEHKRGDMWGYSNEPFVSKILRHPTFDKNNKQYRFKTEAVTVQRVLEWANGADEDDLFEALVYLMRLGMVRIANAPKAPPAQGRNLEAVRCFLHTFLEGPADGGSRLTAATGAFIAAFNPDAEVRAFDPNAADEYAKRAGDIEVEIDKKVVTGYECKDRPFDEQDVKDGIKKASDFRVAEYVFISGFHSAEIDYDFSDDSRKTGLDLAGIHLPDVLDIWLELLNIKKRAELPKKVVEGLVKMRRTDVAKVAEEIWKDCLRKSGQ